jgi:hypothetical protein
MFYSWLVPHSFGGSLVLPIQQVQDGLAPSMGAFFGACNMAGGQDSEPFVERGLLL